MHLHGHNIFVLAEGEGDWDGNIVNSKNPQRRDVQMVRPNGHLVIQWFQDNPGAWVSDYRATTNAPLHLLTEHDSHSTATSHGI